MFERILIVVIYDNQVNESLVNKLEKVLYQASCLAITGVIQGTSRESFYKELGLEPLQSRRWYKKMKFFKNILNGLTPKYEIWYYTCVKWQMLQYKSSVKVGTYSFYTITKSFINTFSPFCIKEWSKLDIKIRNLLSVSRFKKLLLIYFKTVENSVLDVHNPIGINLLNRLRLNFSEPNENEFCQNFRDTVNPFCLCNLETEATSHYLLCFLCFETTWKPR